MTSFRSTMRFLSRYWFLLGLFGGVVPALIFPQFFQDATQFLEPRWVIFLALLLMAFTMPSRNLMSELAWPVPALWTLAITYGLTPACSWLLGNFLPHPDLRLGLMIVACVPCTLASAVLWTRLAGGNEATALLAILASTMTSWFFTTVWLTALTGAHVAIRPLGMMGDLFLTLILPVVLGQVVRGWGPLALLANRRKVALGVISQLLILAIVIKAGALVGIRLQHGTTAVDPWVLAYSALLAAVLHLAALWSGFWTSRWLRFDRPRQIAVAFASSQKTLPVALFLFQEYFQESFPLAVVPLLFFHLGQFLLDTLIAQRLKVFRP